MIIILVIFKDNFNNLEYNNISGHAGMAKLQLYAFDNMYIDIMGSQPIEKDF